MDTTFGRRLRDLRLAAELSQSELSEKSGIPKPTLSRYENDHVSPSLQTLERLADALGCTEAALLVTASPQDAFLRALHDHGVSFETVADAERVASEVAAHLRDRTARAG